MESEDITEKNVQLVPPQVELFHEPKVQVIPEIPKSNLLDLDEDFINLGSLNLPFIKSKLKNAQLENNQQQAQELLKKLHSDQREI